MVLHPITYWVSESMAICCSARVERTTSPIDTMPMTRPLSATGRWRMRLSVMMAMHWLAGVSGWTTMTRSVMTAVTGAPDGAKITWQSSDESIVTVSENGVLTAKGKGTATVKAAVDDSELTCIVRCNFEDRSGEGECTISNSDVTMGVKGETFQISLRDANGDKNTGLLWVSSDVSVCSVDGTGVVKAEGKEYCLLAGVRQLRSCAVGHILIF